MFTEKFKIRWSDVDANRHLANASYMNYCSQTRMSFLNSQKITLSQLLKWNVGPVVLDEKFSYYKEFYADQEVFVTLDIVGKSEDFQLFKFEHNFYNKEGIHQAKSTVTMVWLDLIHRKTTTPPNEIMIAFNEILTNNNIELLTFDQYKKENTPPKNISEEELT